MGYNKFKWWRFRTKKKLPSSVHLFDRIVNGDFEYSDYFAQAKHATALADQKAKNAYNNYLGFNEQDRQDAANEASHLMKVRSHKLLEDANLDEDYLLYTLKKELRSHFGFCLWDEAMEKDPMDTIELYQYYAQEYALRKNETNIDLK